MYTGFFAIEHVRHFKESNMTWNSKPILFILSLSVCVPNISSDIWRPAIAILYDQYKNVGCHAIVNRLLCSVEYPVPYTYCI